MSRFYSMSYQDVMNMPLRGFWSFNAQIRRLRGEENLNAMELHLLGGFGTDGDTIEKVRRAYAVQMGDPMRAVETIPDNPEIHRKGIEKLRAIKAMMGQGAPRTPNVDPQPQS